MKSVGSYEAKTHLPALLLEVAAGQEITITKRGVPVARLVPIKEPKTVSPSETIRRMRELSVGQRLNGLTIRELIEEGRS